MQAARILVVGYERALVKCLSIILQTCGYQQVDTEFSCAGALHKAQAQPPDILIMSARMPEISGIETGLRISHQSKCGVLFVTANYIEQEIQHLRAQGCVCTVLSLPFEYTELLTELQLLAAADKN